MKINTVAVYGAGAIGSYFISGLSERLGENLWTIASGERAERMRKEGLVVNDEQYGLNVRTPEEAHGVDLLLISVKYGALWDALDDISKIVDEHTIVLSLLNGVDSEQILSDKIGPDNIVHSLMKIAAERVDNSVRFNVETTPGLFYGELSGDMATERVLAIAELLDGTSIHYHIVPDIIRQMWYKFALNVSQNLPQAIIGIGFGGYADSEHMSALRTALRNEVSTIAAAKGIDISTPLPIETKSSPTAKRGRYSTLQDLDAKRHTEVDLFAGAMMKMGEELNIPVPYSTFAYHAIKALEEKNDGVFDYEYKI